MLFIQVFKGYLLFYNIIKGLQCYFKGFYIIDDEHFKRNWVLKSAGKIYFGTKTIFTPK